MNLILVILTLSKNVILASVAVIVVFDKNLTKNKTLGIYRVAVNDNWEASFTYNDPTLEVCQGESKQFVLFLLISVSQL